jgi:hypothetical protein
LTGKHITATKIANIEAKHGNYSVSIIHGTRHTLGRGGYGNPALEELSRLVERDMQFIIMEVSYPWLVPLDRCIEFLRSSNYAMYAMDMYLRELELFEGKDQYFKRAYAEVKMSIIYQRHLCIVCLSF